MKTSIKKLPDSKIEILIEISSPEFDFYYKKTVSRMGKNAEIKGFRPGHIPSDILEKEIGQEKIMNQAAAEAIKEKYVQAITDNKLEAIEKPEIEILKLALSNPFIFKAKTTVLPEIELPDYKKIASSVKKQISPVENKEIEETINYLRRSRAKLVALNRAAQKGDFVEIEYHSPLIDGDKQIKDSFVLGEGRFIKGFEEKLEAMKSGEEKSFSLELPEDYFSKELAGKEIGFKVKMAAVFKMELPEFNDRFVQSLGDFKDSVAFRKNIEEGLKIEKEREGREKFRQEILEKIIKSIEWKIPDILIEAERNRLLDDLKVNLSQNRNISFQDYLKKIKKSEEEIKKSLLEPSQKNVKTFLILKEIAKKENIKASEGEIEGQTNEILKNYPDFKTVQRQLDLERLKEYTKERIINEKVFGLLEKSSNVDYAFNSNNS